MFVGPVKIPKSDTVSLYAVARSKIVSLNDAVSLVILTVAAAEEGANNSIVKP